MKKTLIKSQKTGDVLLLLNIAAGRNCLLEIYWLISLRDLNSPLHIIEAG